MLTQFYGVFSASNDAVEVCKQSLYFSWVKMYFIDPQGEFQVKMSTTSRFA